MDISIFDVVGPVMIGPSSSHTAGAARLAKAARMIVKGEFFHVSFHLHGSFAKTGKGHGTDKALVAGVLGMSADDEALAKSFQIAEQQGITFDFCEEEMENVHENTVRIQFKMKDNTVNEVVGSSIGGGQILIAEINGFATDMNLQLPTIVISQYDKKGVVTEVSGILTAHNINIANMKLIRRSKGDVACCIIETDEAIPEELAEIMMENENIVFARVINMEESDV